MLRLAYIGGFGAMASPSARHLQPIGPAHVLRVHDSGKSGERREAVRHSWQSHGAVLCPTIEATIGDGKLDGVVVCTGKNGDDLEIIAEVTARLSASRGDSPPFILHLSTVSAAFARIATDFCTDYKIDYANYPLTGGPRGAELGGEHLLILAGGKPELFERATPFLEAIGRPRFFGESPDAGARVKLIGQMMVLSGCLGITAAAALYGSQFCGGALEGEQQTDFFNFINSGAGGTRQWDVALSRGVRDKTWDQGFMIKHAAIDALYAAQSAEEAGLSRLAIDTLLNMALAFSYLMKKFEGRNIATHALARELVSGPAQELDRFIQDQQIGRVAVKDAVRRVQSTFPEEIRSVAMLEVAASDFYAAGQKFGSELSSGEGPRSS